MTDDDEQHHLLVGAKSTYLSSELVCAPRFVISGPKWEVGDRTQNETRRRRLETRRRPPEIDAQLAGFSLLPTRLRPAWAPTDVRSANE